MFDISKITVVNVRKDKYSFVGLQQERGQLRFYLPHGFDEFSNHSFDNIKSLFFLLYKTLKKYESENSPDTNAGRDGVQLADGGFRFIDKNGNPVVLYSRLKTIDAVLDKYDDTKIFGLIQHLFLVDDIDYSQFDRIIEYAKYTYDDTPVFEKIPGYVPLLSYSSTDLVSMYCYVLTEIKEQLQELDDIREEIKVLARIFKTRFLTDKSRLFSSVNYSTTVKLLKDALEVIDKHTSYKGEDYWNYYEALELFLYSDPSFSEKDGVFWGIKNFWSVWERICHSFAFQAYGDSVKFADINNKKSQKLSGLPRRVYVADDFINPFYSNVYGKWRIPDLVILDSSSKASEIKDKVSIGEFFRKYELHISKDNWDDYGHKTKFNLTIAKTDNTEKIHLSELKVAKLDDMLNQEEPENIYYDVNDILEPSTFRIAQPLSASLLSSIYIDEELQEFFDTKLELLTLLYVLNNVPLLCIIEPHRVPLEKLENSTIFLYSLFRGMNVNQYIEELLQIMTHISCKILLWFVEFHLLHTVVVTS